MTRLTPWPPDQRSCPTTSGGPSNPKTKLQLKGRVMEEKEARRQQQIRAVQDGDSSRARKVRAVLDEGDGHLIHHGLSRRCEVVRSRIQLGYRYSWQVGIATPDDRRRCRLCAVCDGHDLIHYLCDCEEVCVLRAQYLVSDPSVTDFAIHFISILPHTLRERPQFCDTNP